MLVRVQAHKDVAFDMLENKFIKALHQDGNGSQMALIIKTGHSRPSRYGAVVAVLRQEVLLLSF